MTDWDILSGLSIDVLIVCDIRPEWRLNASNFYLKIELGRLTILVD